MSKESGQSLIEVMVAVSISMVVLVGLLSITSLGLTNSELSRNKTRGNEYAQEAVEWLRGQRDANWNTFYTRAPGTYCLNTLAWQSGACSAGTVINDQYDLFTRQITLTPNGIDRVTVVVTVRFPSGERTELVQLNSTLTKWK